MCFEQIPGVVKLQQFSSLLATITVTCLQPVILDRQTTCRFSVPHLLVLTSSTYDQVSLAHVVRLDGWLKRVVISLSLNLLGMCFVQVPSVYFSAAIKVTGAERNFVCEHLGKNKFHLYLT